MLLYSHWSTSSPSSSGSRTVEVAIGDTNGFASLMSNFFSKSLVYFVWWTNVPYLICIPRKKLSSPIINILNFLLIVSANLAISA